MRKREIMKKEFNSDPSATVFDMIPSNAFELRAKRRQASTQKFLPFACVLLVGGLGYIAWLTTLDSMYLHDGTVTKGTITSFQSQSRTTKGRTNTTHTIHYTYKSDSRTQLSGWDKIQSWKDVPKSQSTLHPQTGQSIDVEYLKSNPQASRIVILNRYRDEYTTSITATVVAIAYFVFRFINVLPGRQRAKCLGVFLLLTALSVALGAIRFPTLSMVCPFLIIPAAYGFFLLARNRHAFQDLQELQRLESLPPLGDRASILLCQFLGMDASAILDHQKGKIHFLNCHVTKGFTPKLLDIYSCDLDSLEISQQTSSTKQGTITQAILESEDGTTKLDIQYPGVNTFLALDALHSRRRVPFGERKESRKRLDQRS